MRTIRTIFFFGLTAGLLAGCELNTAETSAPGVVLGAQNTEPGEGPPIPEDEPEYPPSNLVVTSSSPDGVTLTYECGGPLAHRVERRKSGGAWTTLSESSCTEYIYDDTVDPLRTYCYRVTAYIVGGDSFTSNQACTTVEPFPKLEEASELDRGRADDEVAELDMPAGWLSRVPVSAYWTNEDSPLVAAGMHDVAFRTICDSARSRAGECDTGLIVAVDPCNGAPICAGRQTLYNDDDPDPAAHGTGSGLGSFVDPPASTWTATYTAYVFSRNRASSYTRVQYSLNGGASWTNLTGDLWVGGTTVNVGPLQDGDWVEVDSRYNGQGHFDTDMVLFQVGLGPAPVTNIGQGTGGGSEMDPRVDVGGDAYAAAPAYVLLGNVPQDATYRSAEAVVDLYRGPQSAENQVFTDGCIGVLCGTSLAPGRYLLSLLASIDMPVGAYDPNDPATWHLSGDQPLLWEWVYNLVEHEWEWVVSGGDHCPNDARDDRGDETWFRGQPNDVVMTLTVEKWARTGKIWQFVPVATRDIPRGAFGAPGVPGNEGLNRFVMELAVDEAATYRLRATPLVAGVTVSDHWRWQRNALASELKVVSYNTLYGGPDFNHEKYKNVADLMGTRGDRNGGVVRMPSDQAPYQWEADVIGLQEVSKASSHNEFDDYYTDVVLQRLSGRTTYGWEKMSTRGEAWPTGWDDGPGMSPLFISDLAIERGGWHAFVDTVKQAAGCGSYGDADRMECELEELGPGDALHDNYFTGVRAVSRRQSSVEDRPVAVFNLHMQASDGPRKFSVRRGELESLIETIDDFIAADHDAFNRGQSDQPDRLTPGFYQNRMIILGDWNVRSHECGEHYWMIRRLREHYGYAVDVSMAVLDRNGRPTLGTHDNGAGYRADEQPADFQHHTATDHREEADWSPWRPAPDFSDDSRYPWWAVDYRDTSSDPAMVAEKLSMIVLVGRGWAYDDPVQAFSLMKDYMIESPLHARVGGVEMWRDGDCSERGAIPNGFGYRPNFSLGCDGHPAGGTNAGAPALHSDHRPLGARLRIYSR